MNPLFTLGEEFRFHDSSRFRKKAADAKFRFYHSFVPVLISLVAESCRSRAESVHLLKPYLQWGKDWKSSNFMTPDDSARNRKMRKMMSLNCSICSMPVFGVGKDIEFGLRKGGPPSTSSPPTVPMDTNPNSQWTQWASAMATWHGYRRGPVRTASEPQATHSSNCTHATSVTAEGGTWPGQSRSEYLGHLSRPQQPKVLPLATHHHGTCSLATQSHWPRVPRSSVHRIGWSRAWRGLGCTGCMQKRGTCLWTLIEQAGRLERPSRYCSRNSPYPGISPSARCHAPHRTPCLVPRLRRANYTANTGTNCQ